MGSLGGSLKRAGPIRLPKRNYAILTPRPTYVHSYGVGRGCFTPYSVHLVPSPGLHLVT